MWGPHISRTWLIQITGPVITEKSTNSYTRYAVVKSYSCIYAFACTNNNLIALKLPFACLLRALGGSQNVCGFRPIPYLSAPRWFQLLLLSGVRLQPKDLKGSYSWTSICGPRRHWRPSPAAFNNDKATSYTKQKDSLQKELKGFLSKLPGYVKFALSLHVTCVIF